MGLFRKHLCGMLCLIHLTQDKYWTGIVRGGEQANKIN